MVWTKAIIQHQRRLKWWILPQCISARLISTTIHLHFLEQFLIMCSFLKTDFGTLYCLLKVTKSCNREWSGSNPLRQKKGALWPFLVCIFFVFVFSFFFCFCFFNICKPRQLMLNILFNILFIFYFSWDVRPLVSDHIGFHPKINLSQV